jgi:diaminopimelate epimerase
MTQRPRLACEIWSGAGNDFVLIDAAGLPPRTARGALARHACAGGCGRQVDGLILVAGQRAELWNRDGSHPAFCGNGARCVAARLLERLGTDRVHLRFGDLSLVGWREGREIAIRVPAPRRLRRRPNPMLLRDALGGAAPQLSDAALIRAGVPHLCLRLTAGRGRQALVPTRHAALRALGRRLRAAAAFGPGGTNVTFVWGPTGRRAIFDTRTYERGVEDLTRACGSGALAAARLLFGRGSDKTVTLRVASGARLTVERAGAGWVLRGPARRIKRGGLTLPAPVVTRRAKRAPRSGG